MDKGKAKEHHEHFYKPEVDQPDEPSRDESKPQDKATAAGEVEWTASEFIAHHKSFGWYAALLLGIAAVAGLAYLITHDRVTLAVIIVGGLLFGFAGSRKPKVIAYRLDPTGLTVGQRLYPYANFKAFMVVEDDHFSTISLMPLKRFMPSLSMYFDPGDQARIMATLSNHLPMQPGSPEFLDSLMRHIRF